MANFTTTRSQAQYKVVLAGLLVEGRAKRHAEYFAVSAADVAGILNAFIFTGNASQDQELAANASSSATGHHHHRHHHLRQRFARSMDVTTTTAASSLSSSSSSLRFTGAFVEETLGGIASATKRASSRRTIRPPLTPPEDDAQRLRQALHHSCLSIRRITTDRTI